MKMSSILSQLQLPISEDELQAGILCYERSIPADKLEANVYTLSDELLQFLDSGVMTRQSTLFYVLDHVLSHSQVASIGLSAELYCDLASSLMRENGKDTRSLTAREVVRLMSRVTLIYSLIKEHHFSASQVSRLLLDLESDLDIPYKSIQKIANKLCSVPAITKEQLESLCCLDEEFMNVRFTDSSALEASEVANDLASNWMEWDLASRLRALIIEDGQLVSNSTNWPYIQMLHWSLVPLEWFDHPASYLYEFKPRGDAAAYLFGRYGLATGNPVLNNAKAVSRLDTQWARNRAGGDAYALVEILAKFESLPFAPRRAVARIIRAWCMRMRSLASASNSVVMAKKLSHVAHSACALIQTRETNTKGVLEQRIVDALGILAFGLPGWRPRGLGDSVNASNLSRKKLGDIEFTNVNLRRSIAVEAHGGQLTRPYVLDHQKSFSRALSQRLESSWLDLDEAANWSVQVIFVAHSLANDLPESDTIFDVPIEYEYWNYDRMIQTALESASPESIDAAFREYFVEALNKPVVPQWIREQAVSLLDQLELHHG